MTALAVVAFSEAGMAKTKKTSKQIIKKELSSRCVRAINKYIDQGYEWWDACSLAASKCD